MKKYKTSKKTIPKKSSSKAIADKKPNRENWLLGGLLGVAILGGGIAGWQYVKRKQEAEKSGEAPPSLPWPVLPPLQPTGSTQPPDRTPPVHHIPKPRREYVPPPRSKTNPVAADGFPLKRGSRGDTVQAFQQALINTYGKQVLPRYGADGQFGVEMTLALKKLKLPAAIDETTFNILVKTSGSGGGNTGTGTGSNGNTPLVKSLAEAATKKDFAAAIKALKQISSTEQYTQVSDEFKALRIGGGVRQTLVNGMLNSFGDETQKRAIRLEFQRMGLLYDGSKWSLSGLNGLPIVTIAPATVWLNAKQSIQVAANTVLGKEISRRLDYTLFESKGKHYLVQTSSVAYL
jgi:hypothetical protein